MDKFLKWLKPRYLNRLREDETQFVSLKQFTIGELQSLISSGNEFLRLAFPVITEAEFHVMRKLLTSGESPYSSFLVGKELTQKIVDMAEEEYRFRHKI